MSTFAKSFCLVALSLAFGCGGDEELGGSLSQIYRLDHSSIRARLYSSELSIEYVSTENTVPVRVSLRLGDDKLEKGTYDLAERGEISGRLRNGTDIPRFSSGAITLSHVSEKDGGSVRGSFHAQFPADRDVLTLSGKFDTTIEVIETAEP